MNNKPLTHEQLKQAHRVLINKFKLKVKQAEDLERKTARLAVTERKLKQTEHTNRLLIAASTILLILLITKIFEI